MSNIGELFSKKNKRILSVYYTAGFPELNSTMTVISSLQKYGADLIEIGMPYSDPLADGPVIQASSTRALANGMTIQVLFGQLRELRKEIGLPVLLMGYMNPVLQYGFERFCADAKSVGIDGLILPDLPMHEFEQEYVNIIKKQGLDFIFLVTPETSEQRIRSLDALSSGFLYAVSSSSTTGGGKNMSDQSGYFKKLSMMKLKNPVLVGFGIRDKQSFDQACEYTQGAIIGTAYIRALEASGDIDQTTKIFLDGIIG